MLSDAEFESLGFTFIWRIENFNYLRTKDECITSPTFVMKCSQRETTWNLEVYPKGTGFEGFEEHCVSYRLNRVTNSRSSPITLDYELSILAADGSLQESAEIERRKFYFRDNYGEKRYVPFKMFRQKKNLYLPQNTLTLFCRMWESGNVDQWLGQTSARTHIGVVKKSINWPTQLFNTEFDNTLEVDTEKEIVISSLNEKVTLKLYLEYALYLEYEVNYDTNLRMDILQSNTNKENWMICKTSVVDSEGSLALSTEGLHRFEKKEGIQVWNFPFSICRSSLLKDKDLYFMPNDLLRLQIDLALSIGVVYSELEHSEVGPYTSPHVNNFLRNVSPKLKVSNSLNADLKSLYLDKALCDFTLIVGSESFSAHKAVLAARSPVIRAMISSDTLESKTHQVSIPDVDSDTAKRMLHYMYSDTIEDPQWEHVSKLYSTADKYRVQSLKEDCCAFLKSHLCAENVVEALELGDAHQDISLKDAAVEFIFRCDDILVSEEWETLMRLKSQLAAETTHSLYLKKIGKHKR